LLIIKKEGVIMIMNELNNDVVFYMSVMMVVLTVAVGIVFGVAKAKIKP